MQAISDKIQKAMLKNETLPVLERLDKEEFVIDFKEREKLLAISAEKVNHIRNTIETENMKKRVIRNRIKNEFWDSMEVMGQSIKSFNVDPMIGRTLETTNYPLRKRSRSEKEDIEKIKRLRKVKLLVSRATVIFTMTPLNKSVF